MATPFTLKPGYITKPVLLKIAKTEAPWLTNREKAEIIADLCGKHQDLVQSYTATKKAFAPEFVNKFRAEFGEGAVPLTKEEKENPFGPDYVSVKELATRWKSRKSTVLNSLNHLGFEPDQSFIKEHSGVKYFHNDLVRDMRQHVVGVPTPARRVYGGKKKDLEAYDTFG